MSGPTRHRVSLPTSGQWPRAGKIRLGTATPTGKKGRFGQDIVRPQKANHFVVREDESGITTAEAAAAFREVYGDEPRQLRVLLAGDTPDDCMEGAYRLYGQNKLKLRCDGELCSERTQTGWRDVPCVCKANNVDPASDEHCTLTYTINLILPDVAIPGIWQLDTGSEISSRNMADFLDMLAGLRRGESLRFMEADLFLVEQHVQPAGMTKAMPVYVLRPQPRGATVQQLLSGQVPTLLEQHGRGELPPPAADTDPEATLDRSGFDESASGSASPALPGSEASDPGSVELAHGSGQALALVDQIKALGADDKERLRARATELGVKRMTPAAAAAALTDRYGDFGSLVSLLDQLDMLDASDAAAAGAEGADDQQESML